jgi:hypothetical protein
MPNDILATDPIARFVTACWAGNDKPWKPFLVFVGALLIIEFSASPRLNGIAYTHHTVILLGLMAFGIWVTLSMWRCASNSGPIWKAGWRILAILIAIPTLLAPIFLLSLPLFFELSAG